jgi:hypothetical protein
MGARPSLRRDRSVTDMVAHTPSTTPPFVFASLLKDRFGFVLAIVADLRASLDAERLLKLDRTDIV